MNDTLPPPAEQPMTDPPRDPRPATQPAAPQRRLRRSDRGPFGGVATGFAEYFGIEAVFVQLAFVALTVFGGSGALLYIAGWFLIPDQRSTDPRRIVISDRASNVIFGSIFVAIALSLLFGSLTFGPPTEFVAALAIVGVGFYLLNQSPSGGAVPPVHGTPQPTPAPVAAAFASDTPPPPALHQPPAPDAHWAITQTHSDVPVVPPEPRPPVTSVTLAIAAVVVGVLLAVDQLTSASISASAMLGAALLVMGLGLAISAFIGRALALIPIGLLTAFGLLIAPIIDLSADGGSGAREIAVDQESDLASSYEFGAGSIELDLSDLTLTEDRTVDIDVGAGYAEIWVPDNITVRVNASSGVGLVEVFGSESAGLSPDRSLTVAPRASTIAPPPPPAPGEEPSDETAPTPSVDDGPTLTINANVRFGYVEVRR